MAISDSNKTDFLWKKVIYGVSNTTTSGKEAPNEIYSSPSPTYANDIWSEASAIPTPAPGATTGVLQFRNPVQFVSDPTVAGNKTWLAVENVAGAIAPYDPNRLRNWVPPTFDPTYLIRVYASQADALAAQNSLNGLAVNEEWVFDYTSGVLHFPNNLPSGTTEIWVVGYRYVGALGLGDSFGGSVNTRTYADLSSRNSATEINAGDIVKVDDNGDGEYAVYLANSDGPTTNFTLISTADSSGTDSKTVRATVNFDTLAGTTSFAFPSQGARITDVQVEVTVAFDATGVDLEVGDTVTTDLFMAADQIDLTTTGTYMSVNNYIFTDAVDANNEIAFTFTPGTGGTVGSCTITVTYA